MPSGNLSAMMIKYHGMGKKVNAFLATGVVLAGLLGLVFSANLIYHNIQPAAAETWGVSFVPLYAEYLGVDPQKTLAALLDDLKIRHFRLTIPWNRVESAPDQFNFSEIEWQLDELGRRDADAIVAIGRRTPRWPECHDPGWLKGETAASQEQKLLDLVTREVNVLKDRKTIAAWQVENEPLLAVFGECPPPDRDLFKREVALVRALDPTRPIITTESGELSSWVRTAGLVNQIGISVYHETWNRYLGKFVYHFPASLYEQRATLVSLFSGSKIFVSELQAEPWGSAPLKSLGTAEQLELMNPKIIDRMVNFARRARFEKIYFWGGEWWYFMKENGHPEIWEALRPMFASS